MEKHKHDIIVNTTSIKSHINNIFLAVVLAVTSLSIYYFPYSYEPIYTNIGDKSFMINVDSRMFNDIKYQINPDRIICWKDRPLGMLNKYNTITFDYSDKNKFTAFNLNSFQKELLDNELLIDNIDYYNNSLFKPDRKYYTQKMTENNNGKMKGNNNGKINTIERIIAESTSKLSKEEIEQATKEANAKVLEANSIEHFKREAINSILDTKRENDHYSYNEDKTININLKKAMNIEVFFFFILPLIFTLKVTTLILVSTLYLIAIYIYRYYKRNINIILK